MVEVYAWVEIVVVAPRELLGMEKLPDGLLTQIYLPRKSLMFLSYN